MVGRGKGEVYFLPMCFTKPILCGTESRVEEITAVSSLKC